VSASLGPASRRLSFKASRRLPRLVTARLRLLPDFLIIGAQRAGTTSLYEYLVAHPQAGPAFKKEVHFFDRNWEKGVDWYRSNFPLRSQRRAVERRGLAFRCGEASPYYLFHPAVPERVAEILPDVRLLAILRNPVDRAYSHYQHEVRKGREPLSFAAALDAEAERLAGQEEAVAAGRASEAHRCFSYLARGRYAEQLERWLERFPRERLLVLEAGTFYADPAAAMAPAFEFIGLPPHRSTTYRKHNAAEYGGMDPELRRRLLDYFRPHNERLFDLLGVVYAWDE
jgi:hypothetical protein